MVVEFTLKYRGCRIYRVAQKIYIHSLLINIFGIKEYNVGKHLKWSWNLLCNIVDAGYTEWPKKYIYTLYSSISLE